MDVYNVLIAEKEANKFLGDQIDPLLTSQEKNKHLLKRGCRY